MRFCERIKGFCSVSIELVNLLHSYMHSLWNKVIPSILRQLLIRKFEICSLHFDRLKHASNIHSKLWSFMDFRLLTEIKSGDMDCLLDCKLATHNICRYTSIWAALNRDCCCLKIDCFWSAEIVSGVGIFVLALTEEWLARYICPGCTNFQW